MNTLEFIGRVALFMYNNGYRQGHYDTLAECYKNMADSELCKFHLKEVEMLSTKLGDALKEFERERDKGGKQWF